MAGRLCAACRIRPGRAGARATPLADGQLVLGAPDALLPVAGRHVGKVALRRLRLRTVSDIHDDSKKNNSFALVNLGV